MRGGGLLWVESRVNKYEHRGWGSSVGKNNPPSGIRPTGSIRPFRQIVMRLRGSKNYPGIHTAGVNTLATTRNRGGSREAGGLDATAKIVIHVLVSCLQSRGEETHNH